MKNILRYLNIPELVANKVFGITLKPRKPSLLMMSIMDFTHESHLAQLNRQNRINDYLIKH